VDNVRQREAAAIPWRQERSQLRSQLVSLHAAEESAHDRVVELQHELDTIHTDRATAASSSSAVAAAANSAEQEELLRHVAELEGQLEDSRGENFCAQRGVEALQAAVLDAQARLSARERRVQFVAYRVAHLAPPAADRGGAAADCGSEGAGRLETQLRASERRCSDLEDIAADHANRLDQCEKERSELLSWRREAEGEDKERGTREAEAAEAQRKRIDLLQSALARARPTPTSSSALSEPKRRPPGSPEAEVSSAPAAGAARALAVIAPSATQPAWAGSDWAGQESWRPSSTASWSADDAWRSSGAGWQGW